MFWYDFLVGDAWDIAAGVVVVLILLGILARSLPAAASWLGPLLALSVITLTWMSTRREFHR
ncbi:MAG: hypothetical protein EPO26_00435 [Chloroflexota bacterium]|nr:MAG: hypothetical protein EPO26_00435 [Chloroflexota bacterium]